MIPVERPLASITSRAIAVFIDVLILSIPLWVANHLAPVVGGLLVLALYAPLLESSAMRATIGKYFMGIQVTTVEGDRISLRTAFIRLGMKLVSSAILFLGHVMALFTDRKQALHDLVAETIVVYGKHEQDIAQAWMESAKSAAGLARGAIEEVSEAARGSKLSQLERLQALREKGALTEEEFQREKAKLLGS